MATRAGLSRGCYHSTRSIAALELPGAVQNRANSCGSAVIKRWAVRTPESAGIHENRRPQTHFARAGPERYLKLCPPQIIELRSEEHTSELQSLMRISYAVFCLKKKKNTNNISKNIYVTTSTSTFISHQK